tara:strand:+ start:2826 stop:4661 length:1836 start_codon:yes stop_codon:yes gene_type:complete
MATNRRIQVSDLDFDNIKANLKSFLQGQNEFSDYDFEGSAMSVLLDVLAYNTHYNGIYTNLAVNEMFLDSASKRSSVVSLAKMLGYLPRSVRASTATVNVTVSSPVGSPASLTLPGLSEFTTQIDGVAYTFYNQSSISITPNALGAYIFQNVPIIQGTPLSYSYGVTAGTKYIIPNENADLSTLTVRVQEDQNSSAYTTYTFADNITDVSSTTRAFFLKEIDELLYEVYFGDGIIGFAPPNGSRLLLNYFVTDGDVANGATSFTYTGSSISGGTVSINTVSAAEGGQEIETIDSIRFNAPRNYSAQNRAVTSEDYKVILPNLFSNIDSVNVWGGEDNNPPIYGKVFIAIKPLSGETLSNATKDLIKNTILKDKNVVSIIPEVVDPKYLYIKLTATVYYNSQNTSRTADTIKALVRDTIINYNDTDLNSFDGMFRFSKLSKLIDASEESILSNITTIKLIRSFTPIFGSRASYVIELDNPIYSEGVPEQAVVSDGFLIEGSDNTYFLEDDGIGNLRLYFLVGTTNTKRYINNNAGTVNYTSGYITIDDINIASASDNIVTLTIKPSSNDVVSVRSQLVSILEDEIAVNAIVDKVASGETSGGSGYIFTSSRS